MVNVATERSPSGLIRRVGPRYYPGSDWGQLQMADHPLSDRLDDFRKMADEARRGAAHATSPEMREDNEHLAKSWDQLIGEIVAAMESGTRG